MQKPQHPDMTTLLINIDWHLSARQLLMFLIHICIQQAYKFKYVWMSVYFRCPRQRHLVILVNLKWFMNGLSLKDLALKAKLNGLCGISGITHTGPYPHIDIYIHLLGCFSFCFKGL